MDQKKNTSYPGIRYRSHPTRKNGVQYDRCFFIRHYVDGKRIEECVGWATDGWTAADVANVRAELQRNKKTGEGPRTLAEKRKLEEYERQETERRKHAEALSLDGYWPTYYEHAKRSKKLNSAEKEEAHYRLWLSPTLGKLPLLQIDYPQWGLLVDTLSAANKSKRTIEYITGTLRRVLKYAYANRLVKMPPPSGKMIGATGPGNSNARLRVMSPDEHDAILDDLFYLDKHAWRITKFAFLTGCRASEAFNLKWRDIDQWRQILIFPETKNRDARELPLTPAIADILKEVPAGELDEAVFKKKDGKPYTEAPSTFYTVVDNLELNNGRSKRDRLVFHSIRHTVATELAKTLNLKDLMEVMGWKTVVMAMRYVHGDVEAKTSALESLHRTMAPKPKKKSGTIVPFRGRP